jgi:hypothetical protein
VKDPNLRFEVELVDGKRLGAKVVLHVAQIRPIYGSSRGKEQEVGESWDWRFDGGEGNREWPTASDGETWEMLGAEWGYYEEFSPDAWKAIGIPRQGPVYARGLYTCFQCTALRRIEQSSY